MSRGATAAVGKRCVLCGVELATDEQISVGLCDSCERRPEGKRILGSRTAATVPRSSATPRPFTAADKSLIRSIHALTPAQDLLRLLNVRLIADLGADAPRYTAEQLQAEIAAIAKPTSAHDWSGLRRILSQARRAGVLEQITPQVIDDFGAVFQLSPAQHLHVRDVIRSAKEGR